MNSGPVGYSVVNVEEIDGAGPGGAVRFVRRHPETTRQAVAGRDGMTFVSVGARGGSDEPRGPF
jgi:hypothetical protein